MKKNLKDLFTAIMMVGMILGFNSCIQDNDEGFGPNVNLFSNVGEKEQPVKGDTLIGFTFRDAREAFVDGGVEYSFIHVNIYKNAGEKPEQVRRSIILPLMHTGVEPQYFHFEDVAFTTSKGDSEKKDSLMVAGEWTANYVALSQNWDAANVSGNSFAHSTMTGAATVIFKLTSDSLKGYEVEFEAPSFTLSEKTLDNVEVIGLPYSGKTWDAVKYESVITAEFSIAEDMLKGENANKSVEVSNLAFFLKHEVKTSLEEMAYVGQFKAEGAELSTILEKVSGKVITRDNNEVIKSETFDLGMVLSAQMSQPSNVVVASENELKDETFKHTLGVINSAAGQNDGMYAETGFAGIDTITLSDAEIVVPFGYNQWAWGDSVLAHAEIANREVTVNGVKNDELSTAAVTVYTVSVDYVVTVSFVGVVRENETYKLSVSYNRSYSLPDDWSHEFSQTGYTLSLKSESASRLGSKEQYNSVFHVIKNRGELYSSSTEKFALNLWASVQGGDTVIVASASKPSVLAIEDQPDKAGWVAQADSNGFAVRYTKDSQIIRLQGGNTIKYEWYNERQYKNDSPIWDYAEVSGNPTMNFSEPVLVDSVLKGNKIEKIYRVNAEILPKIVASNNAQKAAARGAAASNNVNDITISASVYQKVIVNDEFVEGSERIVTVVKKNGTALEWEKTLYETWTISGEIVKDKKSGVITPTLVGSNGEAIVVTNLNVTTSGNGLNATGAGNYVNNATNGAENWTNSFSYNAPASFDVTLNGTKGVKVETINTSFVIAENGQTIGSKSTVPGFDVYPYAAKVMGTYTVENESIELSAEATRSLKMARNIPDITGRKIATVGFSVVPAVKSGNGYAYTSGRHNAIPCMTIGFEDGGAEAVLFQDVPTIENVQNAYYVAGNYVSQNTNGDYVSDYNSGILTGGHWVPAIAADKAFGISYSLPTKTDALSIKKESLAQWGWNSTVLAGYSATVENNVLTVWKGDTIVLEIK